MIVDRIITDAVSAGVYGEKINKKNVSSNNIKSQKNESTTENNIDKDSSRISPEAKKLQETESILRFALQKIEDLDNIRENKLSDVTKKLDEDFYNNPEIDEQVSQKLISDENLDSIINQKKTINNFVNIAKSIDEPLDSDKIAEIKQKIADGFYDQPGVIAETAEKLVDNLI